MDIFESNLATSVTAHDLRGLFKHYGNESAVTMMKKHASWEALGFAFITMPSESCAISTINAFKGQAIEFNFGPRFERLTLPRGETERRGQHTHFLPSIWSLGNGYVLPGS